MIVVVSGRFLHPPIGAPPPVEEGEEEVLFFLASDRFMTNFLCVLFLFLSTLEHCRFS
jgi:hypothetical protein